ncbi:MAG: hypothetical protein WCS03_11735 [Bacteroidota bacterium]|nr:MAG: hypothetical protein D4R78_05260 [bacterium]
MEKNKKSSERPETIYIQGIQNGTINASSLPTKIIEQIIEVLTAEGSSPAQIAQLLDKTDRTVRRYIVEINKKNALTPNLELVKQLVGELVQKARISHTYLLRLARLKKGSIAEKVQAEFSAWRVFKELIEKLQSLGYMPTKPQGITGDIFLHMAEGGEDEISDSKNILVEIEQIVKEAGTLSPETEAQIKVLKTRIQNAELSSEAAKLLKSLGDTKEKKEELDEPQH